MDVIKFKLPLPPPLNSLYRFYKAKMYMVTEGRRYKWVVSAAVKLSRCPKFDDSAKIYMKVTQWPSNGTEARRDADSGLKILLDAFQDGNLFSNDNMIKHLEVIVMPIQKEEKGYITVEFREILN